MHSRNESSRFWEETRRRIWAQPPFFIMTPKKPFSFDKESMHATSAGHATWTCETFFQFQLNSEHTQGTETAGVVFKIERDDAHLVKIGSSANYSFLPWKSRRLCAWTLHLLSVSYNHCPRQLESTGFLHDYRCKSWHVKRRTSCHFPIPSLRIRLNVREEYPQSDVREAHPL